MIEFQYEGVDRGGKIISGTHEAISREIALRELSVRGVLATRINESKNKVEGNKKHNIVSGFRFGSNNNRIKSDDILDFMKELGTLLRAGLPLERALRLLSQAQSNQGMSEIILQLQKDVKTGKSLSLAMSQHKEYFEALHINLIKAGEVSGKLSEATLYLSEHLGRSKALRSSLISALTYPSILFITAILSVALMLGFVVPQFKPLFSDLGDRLPLLTSIVVDLGEFFKNYGLIAVLIIVMIAVSLSRWWKTESGLRQKERWLLSIPLTGALMQRYQVSQFTRTLGSLLSSGVGLMQAVIIARDGLSFGVLRERLQNLTGAIKQGKKLSRALGECNLLDPASIQLLSLGEETGHMDQMLLELTQRQEEILQTQTKRMLALLEPVLILGLGVVVATIIIAILLGILSVNELVS